MHDEQDAAAALAGRLAGAASAPERAAALMAVAEHKARVPLRLLHAALGDADAPVRAAAAFALSKVGSRRSLPHLLRAWAATTARDRPLRRQLLVALGDLGGARALAGPLQSFSRWRDRDLQALALGFLSEKGARGGAALLRQLQQQALGATARAGVERALRRAAGRRAAAPPRP